jgi:cell pole-organizing protein PopZ
MSEAQKENDQSMDDILASIRKIISDDGVPASAVDSINVDSQTAVGVDQVPMEASTLTGAPGKLDDLSDIFEQPDSAVVAEAPGSAAQDNAPGVVGNQTAWGLESGDAGVAASNGSLTDKLASLSGTSSGTPNADVGLTVEAPSVALATETSPLIRNDSLPESSENKGISLEDTLENVRKVAAVAAAPEAAQSMVVEPVPTPEPSVEYRQSEPSREVTRDAPSIVSEVADQLEPAVVVKPPVEIQPIEVAATAAVGADVMTATVGMSDQNGATLRSGQSIELLVTEALKPMLQQWLDANLPRLVEEKLQEELKRRAE